MCSIPSSVDIMFGSLTSSQDQFTSISSGLDQFNSTSSTQDESGSILSNADQSKSATENQDDAKSDGSAVESVASSRSDPDDLTPMEMYITYSLDCIKSTDAIGDKGRSEEGAESAYKSSESSDQTVYEDVDEMDETSLESYSGEEDISETDSRGNDSSDEDLVEGDSTEKDMKADSVEPDLTGNDVSKEDSAEKDSSKGDLAEKESSEDDYEREPIEDVNIYEVESSEYTVYSYLFENSTDDDSDEEDSSEETTEKYYEVDSSKDQGVEAFYDPQQPQQRFFVDPWPYTMEEFSEAQFDILDNSWYILPMPPRKVIHLSIGKFTSLALQEINAFRSDACFDGKNITTIMEYIIHFCKLLRRYDFHNEKNLKEFHSAQGCLLLLSFLQYEHLQVEIACLEQLERYTKTKKYASYLYEVFPKIMQHLRVKYVKLDGNNDELQRAILAVKLIKNISRGEKAKKAFENEKHLVHIFLSFHKCCKLLNKPSRMGEVAFYYAGVIIEILSNMSEKDICKSKITRQGVPSKLKPFFQDPRFQNDVMFLCKNLSTIESNRVLFLEENFLMYVADMLKHNILPKQFLPCTELVGNLLKSPRFVDFVKSDDMIQILTSIVWQDSQLKMYKSSEKLTTQFLEMLQSFIHKYKEDSCVEFLNELGLVELVMENIKTMMKRHDKHRFCTRIQRVDEKTKEGLELRIDILNHLVIHKEMRNQFKSLKALVKLLSINQFKLYQKTNKKVLKILALLGEEKQFEESFFSLLQMFWDLFVDKTKNKRVRLEAALRIAQIYENNENIVFNVDFFEQIIPKLRPMTNSKNNLILEGLCAILNVICKDYEWIKNSCYSYRKRVHGCVQKQPSDEYIMECGVRHPDGPPDNKKCDEHETKVKVNGCKHCLVLLWMINILKRVNRRNTVESELLRNLITFFGNVVSDEDIAKFLLLNSIPDLFMPHITHADETIHSTALMIFKEFTQVNEFVLLYPPAKKLALFCQLNELRKAKRRNKDIQALIKTIAQTMLQLRPLIAYKKQKPWATKGVIMKIFKINRWVR
ncbi:hypothetical protein M8J75_002017 [Diaphorina citri]|nr:hypothetical protein M8J75_002017 [Diaphorina citri]